MLNVSKNTILQEKIEIMKATKEESIVNDIYQIINSNNNNTKVDVEKDDSNKTYEIDVCKRYFELLFGMHAKNSKDYPEKEAAGASVIYTSKSTNNDYLLILKMLVNRMHEKIVIQGENQILVISPNDATIRNKRLENNFAEPQVKTIKNNTHKFEGSNNHFKVFDDKNGHSAKKFRYAKTIDPHGCNICSKTFATKYKLKLHRKYHSGGSPHICKICKVTFEDVSSLKKHYKTHSKDNFYLCDFCGLKFVRTVDFNEHHKNHTWKLPYACDICDKPFRKIFTMRRHRRIHTDKKPFACDVCNISFLRMADLNIHYRKHTGEKPFSCTICGSFFSRKSTMVEHFRRHTGDKPYKCDLCVKSFVTSSKRLHHMRNVHILGI